MLKKNTTCSIIYTISFFEKEVCFVNIIIVGCGKIGKAILANLLNEGHNVTAIDKKQSVLEEITNAFDVMTLCGNGADSDVLNEANAAKCDLFIACTDSDENNMLACFLAQKMGARHSISRIRNPEYNDKSLSFMKSNLGISVTINPELIVAKEVLNLLKLPSAVRIETFSRNFELVEIKLSQNSSLDGITLRDMRDKYKAKYLICTVQREDDVFIPDGNFALKSGDLIGICAVPSEIQKLFKMLGILKKQAKSVMILGGGRPTYYLTKMLNELGVTVKIVDKDLATCENLSRLLPNNVIINGDGAQQDILVEEGLNEVDAFVSLTGMDEENILISLFAALQNVPSVITKINSEELTSLSEKIGVQTIVSPVTASSDRVVQYARALQNSMGSNSIETLYKLMDGKAEALEFIVTSESDVTNVPFKDLNTKTNILIGGIIRGRKIIIPSGNDSIQKGDRVIVLAAGQRLQDLTDILR